MRQRGGIANLQVRLYNRLKKKDQSNLSQTGGTAMKKSIIGAAIVVASAAALLVAETGRGMTTVPDATGSPSKLVRRIPAFTAVDGAPHGVQLRDRVRDARGVGDFLANTVRLLVDGRETEVPREAVRS